MFNDSEEWRRPVRLTGLKVAELREELEERDLPIDGGKSVLQARLRDALVGEGIEPDSHVFLLEDLAYAVNKLLSRWEKRTEETIDLIPGKITKEMVGRVVPEFNEGSSEALEAKLIQEEPEEAVVAVDERRQRIGAREMEEVKNGVAQEGGQVEDLERDQGEVPVEEEVEQDVAVLDGEEMEQGVEGERTRELDSADELVAEAQQCRSNSGDLQTASGSNEGSVVFLGTQLEFANGRIGELELALSEVESSRREGVLETPTELEYIKKRGLRVSDDGLTEDDADSKNQQRQLETSDGDGDLRKKMEMELVEQRRKIDAGSSAKGQNNRKRKSSENDTTQIRIGNKEDLESKQSKERNNNSTRAVAKKKVLEETINSKLRDVQARVEDCLQNGQGLLEICRLEQTNPESEPEGGQVGQIVSEEVICVDFARGGAVHSAKEDFSGHSACPDCLIGTIRLIEGEQCNGLEGDDGCPGKTVVEYITLY